MDAQLHGWHGGNVTRLVLLGEPSRTSRIHRLTWRLSRDGSISTTHLPHLAAVGGSMVTRTTSRFAFQKNGRALLTQDLVGEIQCAFLEVFPDSDAPDQKSGKL